MQKLNQKYINSVVKKALDEDLKPRGDITTNLISFKNKKSKAKIIAKQNGIIAGLDFCKAAFKLIERETVFMKIMLQLAAASLVRKSDLKGLGAETFLKNM